MAELTSPSIEVPMAPDIAPIGVDFVVANGALAPVTRTT